MLNPKLIRTWAGYTLVGEEFEIGLNPFSGELGITVTALPAVTGSEYRIDVTDSEHRLYFQASEVVLTATTLDCFKLYENYSFYREGFQVVLEPGMNNQLAAALPKLFLIAAFARHIEEQLGIKLQRNVRHMMELAYSTFAGIILDGNSPQRAVELTKQYSPKTWDEDFAAEFESDAVRALLDEAAAAQPSRFNR